jgi:DnaK suppressor protein
MLTLVKDGEPARREHALRRPIPPGDPAMIRPVPSYRTGHLDAPQRHDLRAALLQRREALLATLALHHAGASRAQHAQEVLTQDGDDAQARDADREVDLAFTDQEWRELAQIGIALKRLDGSDYGLCEDCGQAIPWARLQARPQALRCVDCEAAVEARHNGV